MRKNHRKKRLIFVISAILLAVLAAIFIVSSFREQIVFFYSPSELSSRQIAARKVIRVGGLVKKGSVRKIDALIMEFVIEDGVSELLVRHSGLTPDLFREGQGIVAKGRISGEIFLSQELLVKHDENYMPPEVEKRVKK